MKRTRVTYDAKAGMAYIYLVDTIAPGEAVRQAIAGDDMAAVLDFDTNGRLLGVELSIDRLHPDLLAIAEQIG
ncbi:DUF2283 domain-containing protein [Kitasatospora sp. NPDC086791]|uniref:DUF2283 domain-containing protein n=1 Tax=Kitasatospora sp. NPDC086791 TaxID=3155178 RepID=UPI00342E1CCF